MVKSQLKPNQTIANKIPKIYLQRLTMLAVRYKESWLWVRALVK